MGGIARVLLVSTALCARLALVRATSSCIEPATSTVVEVGCAANPNAGDPDNVQGIKFTPDADGLYYFKFTNDLPATITLTVQTLDDSKIGDDNAIEHLGLFREPGGPTTTADYTCDLDNSGPDPTSWAAALPQFAATGLDPNGRFNPEGFTGCYFNQGDNAIEAAALSKLASVGPGDTIWIKVYAEDYVVATPLPFEGTPSTRERTISICCTPQPLNIFPSQCSDYFSTGWRDGLCQILAPSPPPESPPPRRSSWVKLWWAAVTPKKPAPTSRARCRPPTSAPRSRPSSTTCPSAWRRRRW